MHRLVGRGTRAARALVLTVGVATALLAAACGGPGQQAASTATSTSPTTAPASTTPTTTLPLTTSTIPAGAASSPDVRAGTSATFQGPPTGWRGNQCSGSPTFPPQLNGAPAVPVQTFPQAAEPSIAPSGSNQVLDTAYSIFDGFTCTHYQHVYEVNSTYVYADCVGWTGNLVRITTPTAWQSLVSRANLKPGYVPSPAKFSAFMNTLAAQPQAGWAPVGTVGEIEAGDVLAWTPETNNSDTSDTSLAGHSVLAISDPVLVAGTTDSYYLVVMDSTATAHGPDDSRSATSAGTPGRNSRGDRDKLVEPFGRSIPPEGLAGSSIEEICDLVQVVLTV